MTAVMKSLRVHGFAFTLADRTMKEAGRLDFAQRSREKQLSRDDDARDLAAGRRSPAEIALVNSMFAAFGASALRNARVIFPEKR